MDDPKIDYSIIGAREREMNARWLAQHPEEVVALWHARDWAALIPYADAIAEDVPIALAMTDPALFRTLRKAYTEIHCRGLAFDPVALRRLAAGGTPPPATDRPAQT
jgi:hypothetical protein